MSDEMQTAAACDVCGRGYVRIAHDGVRCMGDDGGRVWLLPQPEQGLDDYSDDRARRRRLVAPRRADTGGNQGAMEPAKATAASEAK